MAGTTSNYGLQTLASGDNFDTNDYKYTNRDRQIIDRLLKQGAESHVHTGAVAASDDPSIGPALTLVTGVGSIPAGITVRYKYSLVDENGYETAASSESTVATPAAVSAPGAPTLATATTGGTLISGNYYYLLTAYTDTNTLETTAGTRNFITIPLGTSTNTVTLTLPALPSGADGFNVYRRGPGEALYSYITSVDMTVATPPTEYEDTGAVASCNRQPPTSNMTNSSNSVTVTIPGATPTVPVGYTWKIYRTYSAGNWSSSYLVHVVEETSEGSGVIVPDYDDLGISTSAGSPLSTSLLVGQPSKVNFTNMAEVQGYLPVARLSVPYEVYFKVPGTVTAAAGTELWVCNFAYAEILNVRAYLALGSSPAVDHIVVDVNKYDSAAATPGWATIFTNQATRPTVQVGDTVGVIAIPQVTSLVEGDMLTMDIDVAGGGATPTDEDLIVAITMYIRHDLDGDISPTGILGIA